MLEVPWDRNIVQCVTSILIWITTSFLYSLPKKHFKHLSRQWECQLKSLLGFHCRVDSPHGLALLPLLLCPTLSHAVWIPLDSLVREGNGNPLQYSCLENPMDGGAWWAAICGVAQSRTRLKRLCSSSSRTPWHFLSQTHSCLRAFALVISSAWKGLLQISVFSHHF